MEGNLLQDYEMVVIISPALTEEETAAILDRIEHSITQPGGSITNVNKWGMRKLSYPIKSFMEGNYVLTQFKMEPRSSAALEANLRLTEGVLRHLLVRLSD